MSHKLFLVEDSLTQAIFFTEVLRQAGYEVTHFESVEAVLAHLAHEVPDLIMTDFNLPGMNGAELCRRIRQDARTEGIPVLLLTGSVPTDADLRIESGADAVLSKDQNATAFLAEIETLLKRG